MRLTEQESAEPNANLKALAKSRQKESSGEVEELKDKIKIMED